MKKLLFVAVLLASPAHAAYTGAPWASVTDMARVKQLFVEHSSLKDPFSVQFRHVQVRVISKEKGIKTWCGEVNAKNGMGAYAGWSSFYATEGMGDEPSVGIDTVLVTTFCKGSRLDSTN